MTKTAFLIAGKHAVTEALKNPNRKVLKVFLTEDSKKTLNKENQNLQLLKNTKLLYKTKKELDRLCSNEEISHLSSYVRGVLDSFAEDERILMWDLYNEPGQFGIGDKSIKLLELTWEWAREVNPSQPLTACLDGSVGNEIIKLNFESSDILTFHTYEKDKLEPTIQRLKESNRPVICTEYMAREFGTTFQFSLPIFKKHNVGCYNWGLVAGKSQTHFGWETIINLHSLKEKGEFIEEGEEIPEPEMWFHDIFRKDGSPFNEEEVKFIKNILS